jgi:hypothetical protein
MSNATQKNRLGNLFTGGLPEFDNLFNHFFRAEEVAMWRASTSRSTRLGCRRKTLS